MSRKKIRELGLNVGQLPTGANNCITDVKGVRVGHVTLHYPLTEDKNEWACTGVTAILPHGGNIFREKVVATSYVFNGFGKTTGLVQVNELGQLESPIMLTNTFGVPAVTQGTLEYLLEQSPEIGETTGTVNIVVGECNDSYLNSIRLMPVKPEHAKEAIQKASTEKAEEGAVGAGTGMVCFGYKGGIGCSSRIVQIDGAEESYTVGCLVLSNFGKTEELETYNRFIQTKTAEPEITDSQTDGSIIIVLATDAPLNERQLQRMAKRCGIGLGRTGSHMSHGSGDIVIAFSTAQTILHFSEDHKESFIQLREDNPVMNFLFTAAAEATEEAILNSLSCANTTTGRKGRVVKELPYQQLKSWN
ncbi:S58 family peptidase [Robertmurraya yapensis]|uniref:S58 family peptidase n=2 Tax=Bacillaceae TaxID=186817 RepID=A0A3S0LF29_9BACI|nr:P1 family peptidase [Bacillus yapensis]RTR33960.1 S58 family peptidase [Bacillus yapensis]TKS97278.1 P1 family peptidase [Bacillus yapensis]